MEQVEQTVMLGERQDDRIGESSLELRDYQVEAIDAAIEQYNGGTNRTMWVLPTGAGKTVVSSALAGRLMADVGRVLFLAHREELLFQTIEKMRMVLGNKIGIGLVKAEYNEANADIVVASVQTVVNEKRLNQLGKFGMVIVDECHHSTAKSYRKILNNLGVFSDDGPLLLGMTATPDRADGAGLKTIFQDIAYEVGIFDMIDRGYLVDIVAKEIQIDVDFGSIRTTNGDYNAGDSGRVLMNSHAPEVIADAIAEHSPNRKTMVFVPTVAMAHATAEQISKSGVSAIAASGETPSDERKAIVGKFHSGEIQVLVNCDLFTEGTDIPSIETIVYAKPTKSRARYVQAVGRGLRTSIGKDNLLVLDLVGGIRQHRLQTISTLFGLPPKELKKKSVKEVVRQQQLMQEEGHVGKVVATDVEDLRAKNLHWTTTNQGQYVLSSADGLYVLRFGGVTQMGVPGWQVWFVAPGGSPEMRHDALPLDYAQGVAEDFVRKAGAHESPLTKANSAWRDDPVSEGQIRKMRYMGINASGIKTKGQASDSISAAEAMSAIKKINGKRAKRAWHK